MTGDVRVRAPGKVNLSLRVGPRRTDGYHPLLTVFQAVAMFEEVRARPAPAGSGITVAVGGRRASCVPTDERNLAWRAARAVADRAGMAADVRLEILKGVPVAGGMAGGSADAAATLVACDALWRAGLSRAELLALGAGLGADVPFGLVGHTALGTGRGDVLTPVMVRGDFHWAFAVSDRGLPTASVFARFDELAEAGGAVAGDLDPDLDAPLMHALRTGDPKGLGAALHNDLEGPALDLRPDLGTAFDVARDAGALGVVLSGSGPTVAALAADRPGAQEIARAWLAADACAETFCTMGPVSGAHQV